MSMKWTTGMRREMEEQDYHEMKTRMGREMEEQDEHEMENWDEKRNGGTG